ncbi:MAG TPA: cation:proton antiporter [Candidatus Acidoferrales bacterium]|nr:cation:proton antiporter [Candidatus Acidoferrales bacterium]
MAFEIVGSPLTVLLLVVILSFVASLLSDKMKAPYPPILIAIGLALSVVKFGGGIGDIPISGDLILGLLVPPLVFESAMRTRFQTFRTVHKTIIGLSIFGVIISAIITALILNLTLSIPLKAALLFGLIISPTDPVTVVSVLKRVRAPETLTTILESEAYLNNATPVILYSFAATLTFSPVKDLGQFAYVLLGGLGVGLMVAGIGELLHRQITSPLPETSFTIFTMFGSYIIAQSLGMSGLMAVPIAGLWLGNRTMHTAMSDETRKTMTSFWEVVVFLATSFAFLLIGLKTNLSLLGLYAPFVIVAFAAILAARVVSVYPIIAFSRLLGEKMPASWNKVLAFAGLRGAVSVALVLSLPESNYRAIITAMVFGVVLLSLVVQAGILNQYLQRSSDKEHMQETTPIMSDPS